MIGHSANEMRQKTFCALALLALFSIPLGADGGGKTETKALPFQSPLAQSLPAAKGGESAALSLYGGAGFMTAALEPRAQQFSAPQVQSTQAQKRSGFWRRIRLFYIVDLGGPINWVLFGIMCFCFCQCVERLIYFISTRKYSKKHGYMTRLKARVDAVKNLPPAERQTSLEKETALLYYEMNRGLWVLNFISSVSPSIGLLGTVVGLISAFQQIARVGSQVSIQDLSSGIWVAMITTAFGMMISIPGLFFYRTFKRIIEKRMMTMELYLAELSNEK